MIQNRSCNHGTRSKNAKWRRPAVSTDFFQTFSLRRAPSPLPMSIHLHDRKKARNRGDACRQRLCSTGGNQKQVTCAINSNSHISCHETDFNHCPACNDRSHMKQRASTRYMNLPDTTVRHDSGHSFTRACHGIMPLRCQPMNLACAPGFSISTPTLSCLAPCIHPGCPTTWSERFIARACADGCQ